MAKGQQGAFAALVKLQQAHQDAEGEAKTDTTGTDEIESLSSPRRKSLSVHRKSFEEGRFSSASRKDGITIDSVTPNAKVKPQIPSFRRLLMLNRPEWKQAIMGLIGAIAFGFVQPFYAFVLGDMIAVFYQKDYAKMKHEIKIYVSIFMVLAVAAFAVNLLQHYNFAAMGEYLTKRIRVRMLRNIMQFEVGWYDRDENASGAVCSRLASDANMVLASMYPSIDLTDVNELHFLIIHLKNSNLPPRSALRLPFM